MKNGIVISDAGPIFSLAVINRLNLLDVFFDEIHIPNAVWEEISQDQTTSHFKLVSNFFKDKIVKIKGNNHLTFVMDYGESEAIILYQELDANFLLIDDKKARTYAENLGINCIGTLGILITAKEKGIIEALKPMFEQFLNNKRYYSVKLLNSILLKFNEEEIQTE